MLVVVVVVVVACRCRRTRDAFRGCVLKVAWRLHEGLLDLDLRMAAVSEELSRGDVGKAFDEARSLLVTVWPRSRCTVAAR